MTDQPIVEYNLGMVEGSDPTIRRINRLVVQAIEAKGNKAASGRRALLGLARQRPTGIERLAAMTALQSYTLDANTLPPDKRERIVGIAGNLYDILNTSSSKEKQKAHPSAPALEAKLRAELEPFISRTSVDGKNPLVEKLVSLNARAITPEPDDSLQSRIGTAMQPPITGVAAELLKKKNSGDWSQWALEIRALLSGPPRTGNLDIYDTLVEKLFVEPTKSRGMRTVDQRYAGLNLSDISRMDFPINHRDWLRITSYLTSADREGDDNHPILLTPIFFESKKFHDGQKTSQARHANLLAVGNQWAEQLLYNLAFSEDVTTIHAMRELMVNLNDSARNNLIKFCLRTPNLYFAEGNPLALGNSTEAIGSPFYQRLFDLREKYSLHATFLPIGEFACLDLINDVIPRVKDRIKQFGLSDLYDQSFKESAGLVSVVDQGRLRNAHDLQLISEFRGYFDPETMERINNHKKTFDQGTEKVVQEIKASGISKIPLVGALTEVSFEKGHLADRLGLKQAITTCEVNPDGSWQVTMRLNPKFTSDDNLRVTFIIDTDCSIKAGELIESQMPGLTSAFKLMASAVFKDLVTRQKNTRTGSDTRAATPKVTDTTADQAAKDRPARRKARPISKISERSLKDRAWQVSSKREPSIVVAHTRALRGLDDYYEAVGWYHATAVPEAIDFISQEPLSAEDETAFRSIISDAKDKGFKANPDKIQGARFALGHLYNPTDPTEEAKRFTQTWVEQHRVPKLETEEEQSVDTVYTRIYEEGSALGFTDEFIPILAGLDQGFGQIKERSS